MQVWSVEGRCLDSFDGVADQVPAVAMCWLQYSAQLRFDAISELYLRLCGHRLHHSGILVARLLSALAKEGHDRCTGVMGMPDFSWPREYSITSIGCTDTHI